MSEQLCLIGRLRLRVLGGLVKGPWSNAGASEAARRVYAAKALDKQPWTRTLGALEGAGRRNRLRRKRPPEPRGGERGGLGGRAPGRTARAGTPLRLNLDGCPTRLRQSFTDVTGQRP